jgi:hypothetical protein
MQNDLKNEYDETYVEPLKPLEPHIPKLVDGKRYAAKIINVDVLRDQPTWNPETKRFDTARVADFLRYTLDLDVEVTPPITFKVRMSNHEKSNLYKLAKEFNILPAPGEGISGKQLVGRSCRVKIVHSKPSESNGSVFDNVDVSSIEALETFEDDANNQYL